MKQERKPFKYEGRTVYEWDQSLDNIHCFIQLPPLPQGFKPAKLLNIKIEPTKLTVGFKDTPPYLTHQFQGIVDAQESVWYLQDCKGGKQLMVDLQKAQKGVRWGCLFKGHCNLNPLQEEELKKKLLLERFQEQNPGFDFSGAEFNGQVPEARTFMGGPKG